MMRCIARPELSERLSNALLWLDFNAGENSLVRQLSLVRCGASWPVVLLLLAAVDLHVVSALMAQGADLDFACAKVADLVRPYYGMTALTSSISDDRDGLAAFLVRS
jgi:hypothetical protein